MGAHTCTPTPDTPAAHAGCSHMCYVTAWLVRASLVQRVALIQADLGSLGLIPVLIRLITLSPDVAVVNEAISLSIAALIGGNSKARCSCDHAVFYRDDCTSSLPVHALFAWCRCKKRSCHSSASPRTAIS